MYDRTGHTDMGWALEQLHNGRRVRRPSWNGRGMFLVLVAHWTTFDDFTSLPVDVQRLEKLPFVAMKTADDKLVPWLASQADLLGDDWEVVG